MFGDSVPQFGTPFATMYTLYAAMLGFDGFPPSPGGGGLNNVPWSYFVYLIFFGVIVVLVLQTFLLAIVVD